MDKNGNRVKLTKCCNTSILKSHDMNAYVLPKFLCWNPNFYVVDIPNAEPLGGGYVVREDLLGLELACIWKKPPRNNSFPTWMYSRPEAEYKPGSGTSRHATAPQLHNT